MQYFLEVKKTHMSEEKLALTIHEAAAFLGVHPQTVRKLARKNDIPSFKVGRSWRFHKDALQQWVDTYYLRSQGPRVLIVDDELTVRETTRLLLEGANYRASTAVGGAEALARMADELPDVVLLDLQMPVMNGATVLKRIREMYGNIPVIIVTGYPDSELLAQALEYGSLLVLAKPISRQHLLESIQMVLRIPKATGK